MPRSLSKNILVIVGQTATGKSEIAVALAQILGGCEIVSADSMQVYREMDIGTAKPGKELLNAVPHHLIDIVDPSEEFSVAQFQKIARLEITQIHKRGSLPILVGGSGLYVRAVIDPLEFPAAKPGSALRKYLEALAERHPQALSGKLRQLDPTASESIDPQNIRRVVRAIEIAVNKKDLFEVRAKRWRNRRAVYDVFGIGLTLSREILYRRIEARVDHMVAAGLEAEARNLTQTGSISKTAAQALGYKEMCKYFNGEISFDDAIALIKMRTRRFAKRQMTWFKSDGRFSWLEIDGLTVAETAQAIIKLVNTRDFIVS